jgi:hypothetical protein
MPKDVLITPLSTKIEFKDTNSNIDGLIQLDSSDNLSITSPNGVLNLGNGAGHVYIGDGTNESDLIFEQSGSIKGVTGKTITLGQSDSFVSFASKLTTFKGGTSEISIRTLDDGTLSFEGGSGQLFSITDSLSGTIFSVNDISGIPSIEVLDNGTVKLAEYGGRVKIGTGSVLESPVVTNSQTGTSYTLVITDAGKLVERNNAAANTLTVPPNSSVAFPVGTKIDIAQIGAGQTTIVAGSGVTINSAESKLAIGAQYGAATLVKRATDTWILIGNLS